MNTVKNSSLLIIILTITLALLSGCAEDSRVSASYDGEKVTAFKGARYARVNIDGVDCVVAGGSFDSVAAVTCDWSTKEAN